MVMFRFVRGDEGNFGIYSFGRWLTCCDAVVFLLCQEVLHGGVEMLAVWYNKPEDGDLKAGLLFESGNPFLDVAVHVRDFLAPEALAAHVVDDPSDAGICRKVSIGLVEGVLLHGEPWDDWQADVGGAGEVGWCQPGDGFGHENFGLVSCGNCVLFLLTDSGWCSCAFGQLSELAFHGH